MFDVNTIFAELSVELSANESLVERKLSLANLLVNKLCH